MGLFKKIGRAFKKVVKGIGKGIKKTLSAINKVQKKIRKSKLFKALVIAAAVVVTGGAALGAMGATTGAGLFGSAAAAGGTGFAGWMTGTAASLTSTTLGATLAAPFTALGTAIGSTALAVGVPAISNSSVALATPLPAATASSVAASTNPAANAMGLTKPTALTTGAMSPVPLTTAANPAANAMGLTTTPSVTASKGLTWAQRNPKTSAFLNNPVVRGVGKAAGNLGLNVASGYAKHELTKGDPTGTLTGLATEGATQFDPLQVYAATRGIAESDISKYFTFGNTASAGNMPLFQQQTIGVMA